MADVRVILLPGAVMPAEPAYSALLAELGHDVDAVAKDLEVYATAPPPTDYSLDTEVAGVLRVARDRGWDRFHLAGYSAGGAAALAFAASHPQRLLTLALLEPAWAGNWDDMSQGHRELWREHGRLEDLPPDQFMAEFARLQLRPGVPPLPAPRGPAPPWMAQRPLGIRALMQTFRTYDLDREALRTFTRPVYFGLGGLSNPDQFGEEAVRLATVFRDYWVQVFADRHHFDPPHRVEPHALGVSLLSLWSRGEQLASLDP